jgi:hypothetical protein
VAQEEGGDLKGKEMYSIFADCSGDIRNQDDRVIVYAALLADEQLIKKQTEQQAVLLDFLQKRGLVKNCSFEINTHDIVKRSGIWRQIRDDAVTKTLHGLKKIIVQSRVPFIVLLVNRDEGGVSTLQKMQEEAKLMVHGSEQAVEEIIKQEVPEIDVQQLKAESLIVALALLFGLCNGLMDKLKMIGKAIPVVDKQFFRQTDFWEGAFALMRVNWQPIVSPGAFFTWRKKDKLEWYISDEVKEVDSQECFGVQLADFLAYTTRALRVRELQSYCRFCPIKKRQLIQKLPGIYVGVSP